MKRTRINPISEKKREQIKEELPIRKQLCERASGYWLYTSWAYGEETSGVCVNGLCEKCHKPPDWRGLHPHEKVFRAQGGKLSLENSVMLCGKCSSAEHGIKEVSDD